MNQRRFATIQRCIHCAITLLVLLSSACNAPVPRPTAPLITRDASTSPVSLTLWHAQIGPARAQLNEFAGDFIKTYPWITVRVEAKANDGDLLRQGIAAMALNQAPDVMLASPRTLAEFARRDALVNLDPWMDDPTLGFKGEDRSDLLPGALDPGRFVDPNSPLLAFPFDEHGIVLYYNVDALSAAKSDSAPRTWDEFSAAVRSTTGDNARGWVMVPDPLVFYAFLFSQGGNVLSERQTEVQFNGDAGLKTLQTIAALTRGGSAYLADSPENARKDFAQGNAIFLFGSSDDVDAVSAAVNKAGNKFKWGVANIPQDNPDKPMTALDGSSLAIFKSSPERERAAWLFVRWLGTPEQSARWSTASLGIPVRLSARSLLASNPSSKLPLASIGNLVDPLPTGRGSPTIKDAASLDQAIAEMWAAVGGGTDPATALSRAVTRANRVLGQRP